MAYDLETKENARMMWLKGISFEKISQEIDVSVPTLHKWSVEDNWKGDLNELLTKVKSKNEEALLNDIDKMNQIHLAQLAASHTLIRDARVRVEGMLKKGDDYKPRELRALTSAMRDLTASLETTLKNERLIRNVSTDRRTFEGEISWRDIIYESEKILNE